MHAVARRDICEFRSAFLKRGFLIIPGPPIFAILFQSNFGWREPIRWQIAAWTGPRRLTRLGARGDARPYDAVIGRWWASEWGVVGEFCGHAVWKRRTRWVTPALACRSSLRLNSESCRPDRNYLLKGFAAHCPNPPLWSRARSACGPDVPRGLRPLPNRSRPLLMGQWVRRLVGGSPPRLHASLRRLPERNGLAPSGDAGREDKSAAANSSRAAFAATYRAGSRKSRVQRINDAGSTTGSGWPGTCGVK